MTGYLARGPGGGEDSQGGVVVEGGGRCEGCGHSEGPENLLL